MNLFLDPERYSAVFQKTRGWSEDARTSTDEASRSHPQTTVVSYTIGSGRTAISSDADRKPELRRGNRATNTQFW